MVSVLELWCESKRGGAMWWWAAAAGAGGCGATFLQSSQLWKPEMLLRLFPSNGVALRRLHADRGILCAKYFNDDDLFLDDPPKIRAPPQKPVIEKKRTMSFKKRTEAYMLPFCLDVFISKRYIHASIMHRVTSRVVAVASTNSKDLKAMLTSRSDITACRVVGEILAERAHEADVFTAVYIPRKNEKLEGKLLAVVDSLRDSGVTLIM